MRPGVGFGRGPTVGAPGGSSGRHPRPQLERTPALHAAQSKNAWLRGSSWRRQWQRRAALYIFGGHNFSKFKRTDVAL